jgi:CheY-like chemotaxis protein
VLVVDDEVPLCELLQSALTSRGYRVTCAMDGLEAIEKLGVRHQHYDVMLLDLNMPGASGLEVARRARITRPELPVVVLTGHLTPEARAELEACGCRSFVTKPYALHDLGRMIREVLADVRRD